MVLQKPVLKLWESFIPVALLNATFKLSRRHLLKYEKSHSVSVYMGGINTSGKVHTVAHFPLSVFLFFHGAGYLNISHKSVGAEINNLLDTCH